ncbi:MAG: hypothetical protein Q4A49_05465 [Neisseria sp.]|nr:hypothetical protein [Neisseria sp.]
MQNPYLCAAVQPVFSGCLALSGNYDADSRPLSGIRFTATGSCIYTARNGMCAALQGKNAVIRIYDLGNGRELSSESPYRCR